MLPLLQPPPPPLLLLVPPPPRVLLLLMWRGSVPHGPRAPRAAGGRRHGGRGRGPHDAGRRHHGQARRIGLARWPAQPRAAQPSSPQPAWFAWRIADEVYRAGRVSLTAPPSARGGAGDGGGGRGRPPARGRHPDPVEQRAPPRARAPHCPFCTAMFCTAMLCLCRDTPCGREWGGPKLQYSCTYRTDRMGQTVDR